MVSMLIVSLISKYRYFGSYRPVLALGQHNGYHTVQNLFEQKTVVPILVVEVMNLSCCYYAREAFRQL